METDTQQRMGTVDPNPAPSMEGPVPPARVDWRGGLWKWFTAWEIYPVLLVALILRVYRIGVSGFDGDQAVLWNMARMALAHGWIPTNGNLASIGTVNPPAYIYLLMPVAALTSNPLAGALWMALLNVVGVALTYAFTRRYYGRLAGFVAAGLTASEMLMVQYSRFIWQPNVLLPLIVLYMMALYRGAVERRGGWFALALFLLGLAFQMSGSSIYLAPALVVALVLGYQTVRWRDLALGVLLCGLLFSTYLVWEAATGYADIPRLLGAGGKHAVFDGTALNYYLRFLLDFAARPTNPGLLSRIFPFLHVHQWVMYALICGSVALLVLGLFWDRVHLMARGTCETGTIQEPLSASAGLLRRGWASWNTFIASPQRRGILLLLAWQVVGLLLISRHSIALQVHYFLVLMPGPFILIALLVSQVARWVNELWGQYKGMRVLVPALAVLLLLVQLTGTVAWVVDNTDGAVPDTLKYNPLSDLQNAVQSADALAQAHHLRRVYLDANVHVSAAFAYLAQGMSTPHMVIENNVSHCLVVPDATVGPAVMLFGPGETADETLLEQYTSATLVSEPSRLGGAPFHLYIVQPLTDTTGAISATGALTLEQSRARALTWQDTSTSHRLTQRVLATVWRNRSQRFASAGSWWTYHFGAVYSGPRINRQSGAADCQVTGLVPGDHLLVPFVVPPGGTTLPGGLTISGTVMLNTPYVLNYGALHFQTLRERVEIVTTFQGIAYS